MPELEDLTLLSTPQILVELVAAVEYSRAPQSHHTNGSASRFAEFLDIDSRLRPDATNTVLLLYVQRESRYSVSWLRIVHEILSSQL